jgi:RimJ/RimL family protein N-acetyltransferase
MELHTQRLLLRQFTLDDWVAVHHYASDMDVVEFEPWGPNSEAETRAFLASVLIRYSERPQRDFEFAVVERASGQLVGGGGVHIRSRKDREGWLGYTLRRESWGRGYGTEVAKRLVMFGFEELSLHRISATCDPQNLRSRRVLEKIGMLQEGHSREDKWLRGRWRDSLRYAVLEQDVARVSDRARAAPPTHQRG